MLSLSCKLTCTYWYTIRACIVLAPSYGSWYRYRFCQAKEWVRHFLLWDNCQISVAYWAGVSVMTGDLLSKQLSQHQRTRLIECTTVISYAIKALVSQWNNRMKRMALFLHSCLGGKNVSFVQWSREAFYEADVYNMSISNDCFLFLFGWCKNISIVDS